MKKLLWLVAILALITAGGWLSMRRQPPPEVHFASATREALVSDLTTNGRAEPAEWSPVRADRAGRIEQVHVAKGVVVAEGAPLVTLDAQEDRDAIARAEARLEQVQAEIALLDAGGRSSERASLDASLQALTVEAGQLTREIASVNRLLEKKAATTQERQTLEDRLARVEAERQGLQQRKAALADTTDKAGALARQREARATLDAAGARLSRSVLRAPRAGVVYNLPVRPGGYLQPGDLIAEVGSLDRMRVVVFVDEPELGRVKTGMPVILTWDGLAGREWTGVVEKLPSGITAQANRQVGEVQTLVDNPGLSLPPGASINARIRTAKLDNALVIPKECVAREKGKNVVFVLNGVKVERREVTLGAASLAKSEVVTGLKDGEPVAILTDQPLTAGQEVRRVE